jgi:hypothetical protein
MIALLSVNNVYTLLRINAMSRESEEKSVTDIIALARSDALVAAASLPRMA